MFLCKQFRVALCVFILCVESEDADGESRAQIVRYRQNANKQVEIK
jgi:hypothetical protein